MTHTQPCNVVLVALPQGLCLTKDLLERLYSFKKLKEFTFLVGLPREALSMKGMELPHDFQGAAWGPLGTALHDGQAGRIVHILEAERFHCRESQRYPQVAQRSEFP